MGRNGARSVLVIGDDVDVREVAETTLSVIGGWDVHTAASGLDGLKQVAAARPDVILLDATMPGMDGHATVEQLRADPTTAGIPVVMLTPEATAGQAPPAAYFGVAGLIAKPFDPMQLPARVCAAVGWSL